MHIHIYIMLPRDVYYKIEDNQNVGYFFPMHRNTEPHIARTNVQNLHSRAK